MKKAPTVTKDISSDYKKLKALRNKGIIKIIGIKIENNADKFDAILPTAVLGHTALGSMKLGSDKQAKDFEELKKIIGSANIKDCIHLEAHIREGYDYFVTEDRDILDKKSALEQQFPGLEIRTTDQLIKELDN